MSETMTLTKEDFEEIRTRLHASAVALVGTCDGARARDGVGYSAYDAQYGRDLAGEDYRKWSLGKCQHVAKFIWKYRKQLANIHGIDVMDLQSFDDAEMIRIKGSVSFDGEMFIFTFKYNKDQIADLKRFAGRRNCFWNKDKVQWEVRISEASTGRLLGFAKKWSMDVSDEVSQEIERLKRELELCREQPWMINEVA